MPELLMLLSCLSDSTSKPLFNQLILISEALLSMRGRITMLGISRWTLGKDGGSYRSIQRFFNKTIPWMSFQWTLIRAHLLSSEDVILLAGDETTVTKSGKSTFGLGRFFSSIYERTVPGVSYLNLSIISVTARKAYPLIMAQAEPSPKAKSTAKPKVNGTTAKKKRKSSGRPKGSKNKSKEPELSKHLLWIQSYINRVILLVSSHVKISYFLYDGAFGNNNALSMVKQSGLMLISKLNCRSALYFPYVGAYSGRGKRKKYGNKINYNSLPKQYLNLKHSKIEGNIKTDIYQVEVLHKTFSGLLNVCIIIKTNLKTKQQRNMNLFSNDLELSWDKMIDYYSLRFQIEFTFRDAKQHYGLEDFMNIKELPLHNTANMAMFSVNLSHALRNKLGEQNEVSTNDLKALFHGHFYLNSVLKLIPDSLDSILIEELRRHMGSIGKINPAKIAA